VKALLAIVAAVAAVLAVERSLRKGIREVVDHDPSTCVVCQIANQQPNHPSKGNQ